MGLISKIWKGAKEVVNFLPHESQKISSKIWHAATGTPSSAEKRKQQQLMNQQIKDYQAQTELSKNELARAKDEQVAEKRRIQEKQIRSLRRTSSSKGFLGSMSDEQAPSKLGG